MATSNATRDRRGRQSFRQPAEASIGERYGKLFVMSVVRSEVEKTMVQCLCDCGSVRVLPISSLRSGNTRSCGCLTKTHGASRTALYNIWAGVVGRCYNTKNTVYPYYGGRGIKMCPEWRASFPTFAADVGVRPSRLYSLDRIDVNGDYCKENVRWATDITQARNTRANRKIKICESTKPLAEWLEELNLSAGAYYGRIQRGMSPIEALTKPKGNPKRTMTFNGSTKTLPEWSAATGIPLSVLISRFKSGMGVEAALTQPSAMGGKKISFNGETLSVTEWGRRTGLGRELLHSRLWRGMSVERALTQPLGPQAGKRSARTRNG